MRYSELINFNPIETVIELKKADDKDKARELVKTYVMSDEMADKLEYGLISQLQLDEVVDNKGVLIVGNYGTGKSHLMSVVSAMANNEDFLQDLNNKKFQGYIKSISGKFEVLRIELGAVDNSLRNIIMKEIEVDLAKRDINYKFPDSSTLTNNKKALEEMMSTFESKYSDRGYLIVVDELLDYLRTRKEQEVMGDLMFLREIGEFIKNSRFRLICGVQEQLFDNPSFSFVADTLSRVKDRFEQVIIRKEDTAYVVSERILNKTPKQKAKIREHLLPFCPLYTEMSERLEDYVELYPIHPAYIDVFNRVHIAENRHVLKTISTTINQILGEDVPKDAPGIISFDSYWSFIKDNYARRSEHDIREVLDKSEILEEKIAKTFPKPQYKEMALQIIYALSVNRLTTGGIDVRIGLTAENLKDDLCLYMENMPEMDSEFLLSVVDVVLKDIMTLVSGQFIEYNKDNEQYFLDLKKDIDYDARIEDRANFMKDGSLNKYYYSIVYDLLDWNEDRAVPSYEIYEYQLNWDSHNVFRRGYLFLGIPNDRSTAQPPRDYYIYILPPFGDIKYTDEKKSDEVFFKLKSDEEFYSNLKLYAAAKELQSRASDNNIKSIYGDKVKKYEEKLKKWLGENKNTSYNVIFKGIENQLIQLTEGKARASNYKDTVDIAASICLEEHFNTLYPEFPIFKIKVTKDNNAEIISRAIKYFAGQKTSDSKAFIESFGLIENGKINVENSKYAMYLIKEMKKLPKQGVLNRNDILEIKGDEFIDKKFKINNEYFIIILLALVHGGYGNLVLEKITITASNMEKLMEMGNWDVYDFKYIAKPKEAAIAELKRLLQILDLPEGMAVSSKELSKGLESKILPRINEIAMLSIEYKNYINNEPTLWRELLFPEHIKNLYEQKISFVLNEFSNFKNRYNTVAKLYNLNLTMEDLDEIEEGIRYIGIVKEYKIFKDGVEPLINYISNVESSHIPEPMIKEISDAKEKFFIMRNEIKENSNGESAGKKLKNLLNPIKDKYINYYFDVHTKARLGASESKRKGEIINSDGLSNLRKLTEIKGIFPKSKLEYIEDELSKLQTCFELTTKELQKSYTCSKCKFILLENNPTIAGKLDLIENNIEELTGNWTSSLLSALEDPLIIENKSLLDNEQQKLVDKFLGEKALPGTVDTFFINTFNTLFEKLDKVDIDMWEIIRLMQNLGPSTVEDFKVKFNNYIDKQIEDKDIDKVRVIAYFNPDKKNDFLVAETKKVKGEIHSEIN